LRDKLVYLLNQEADEEKIDYINQNKLIIIYVENLKNKNKRVGFLNDIKDFYNSRRISNKSIIKKSNNLPHNI
jgi:hypothetical protein